MSADFFWRDIEGVDPERANSGDYPDPSLPTNPIYTPAVGIGPWGVPWQDGQENPDAGEKIAPSPDPQMDVPDLGWTPLPGAYDGAYRTRGPIMPWGLEPTGGLFGDQAVGRIMRFPANIPDRYDANGVNVGDYRDLLAVTLERNDTPAFTDAPSVADIVSWQPEQDFGGWDG
jgi:hypothetical protein